MPPQESNSRPVFTDPTAPSRRRRADATRRRALSPFRIFFMILMLPVTTAAIAMSVYIRTSEFEQEEALLHLIAMTGCEAATKIIPGPYYDGEPGYHLRNDPDGDGIACDRSSRVSQPQASASPAIAQPAAREVGDAKFLRP